MELIRSLGKRWSKNGNSKHAWGLFLCAYCGKEVQKSLEHGKRDKSCGCAKSSLSSIGITKHGDGRLNSPCRKLYFAFKDMMYRCFNPNAAGYKNYGGRRITVYKKWQTYSVFKIWMLAHGWKIGLEIDRIDNDGNYEPKNCRLVTHAENNRNTSRTILNWIAVHEIRRKWKTKLYYHRDIALQYGVSISAVTAIVNNRSWIE